jgi:hypothetical protein
MSTASPLESVILKGCVRVRLVQPMMRKDAGLSLGYCMPRGRKLKRDFQQRHEKRIPYREKEGEREDRNTGNIKVGKKKDDHSNCESWI